MKKILIYVLIISPFCFAQCKKNREPLNVTLYDKTTPVIESYIEGKWRVRYHFGGICGICRSDREIYNEYYEFKNNRIIYTYQNSVISDTTYNWATYRSNPSDYVHNILAHSFEPYKIMNDTLILAVPMLYNPDASLCFLTKAK